MKMRVVALGASMLGLLAFAPASRAQDAYVIGVSADMTGPAASIYAPVAQAMMAYLDHVNGKGGINGKPVRVVLHDNQGDPARAASDSRKLLHDDRALLLVGTSLSSTYSSMVAETKRANIPLYFAGGVCPKETYPPADPLQFCSTAFAANLDSLAVLKFIEGNTKEPVRLGLAAMAIPIARAELDHAERLSATMGMTVTGKEVTPPKTADYVSLAGKLKDTNPNWVYSWSPWVAEAQIFESLRQQGWTGRYITWAHTEAEDYLPLRKDGDFHVVGANAFFHDDSPMHAEIRAIAQRANLAVPVTQLTEGFIAGMVIEETLKNTPWPPTPVKILAAMNRLKVDLKGLRGGPLEWTPDNHFRTRQHYRVWRWDPAAQKIVRMQDWFGVDVKR